MSIKRGKKIILAGCILVPILLGTLIYYFTSPEVVFVKQIDEFVGAGIHIELFKNSVTSQFIRNYLPDMLWGYALVFALYCALKNEIVNVWKIFGVAFLFSALLEFFQLSTFVIGTFDICDIVAEGLAETLAIFIIKKYLQGGKEK
jgi:glycopeptide antibiotics resistance protein